MKAITTILACLVVCSTATADDIAFETKKPFVVPMTSGESASAMFLSNTEMVVAKPGNPPLLAFFDVKQAGPSPNPNPGPDPDPGPGPNPDPGPTPDTGPKKVLWIEETSQRDPGDASAISDANIRKLLAAAGWSIRVADVDVVDENGNPPADLAPYIEIAKQRGLPYMLILDKNGVELYSGSAPDGPQAMLEILKRFGLPVSGGEAVEGRGKDARPETPPEEKRVLVLKEPQQQDSQQSASEQNCPTGNCPTQPAPTYTRRRGLFR